MKIYSALSGGLGGFWLLNLAKLGITLVVGEGMWLWWVVLLPKGVSLQFISLLSMAVSECGWDSVFPAQISKRSCIPSLHFKLCCLANFTPNCTVQVQLGTGVGRLVPHGRRV